jgi:flavin reductase (DIM6/NTAB) family NADH-FMN oxidoreductase RutF
MKKVEFPIDIRKWHPSLIPGPIVLISTISEDGEPNVAPKSWLQMVSFEPPIMMFSGQRGNTTEKNIKATKCFTVNFASSDQAEKIYGCVKWFGRERLEKCGFTLSRTNKIRAPLVNECRAHLECELHDSMIVGSGLVIFGKIVAASIWEEILKQERIHAYKHLDQILYLENNLYCIVDNLHKLE